MKRATPFRTVHEWCVQAESAPRTTTINAETAEHAETILDNSNTRGLFAAASAASALIVVIGCQPSRTRQLLKLKNFVFFVVVVTS
jgi:hypothetical protein